VLLGWCARLSRWRLTITPDTCIQCRLCENACPSDAILAPSTERLGASRGRERTILLALMAALPLAVLLGGLVGRGVGVALAGTHLSAKVSTALLAPPETLDAEDADLLEGLRTSGLSEAQLHAAVGRLRTRSARIGALAGGVVGLVIVLRLIGLTIRRRREDYTPHEADCVSCGRCFDYCPRERASRRAGEDAADGT
jgi:NAD-dependent dihydropyrimidine dehydrogenase PreA subunit